MMRKTFRRGAILVLVLGVAQILMACSVLRSMGSRSDGDVNLEPSSAADIQAIVDDYREWTAVNTLPRRVADYIYLLCMLPSDEQYLAAESLHGPFFVRVYVNDAGIDLILNDPDPIYPAGTVIVKEKLTDVEAESADHLGIMIKREAGFNPDGGDWEYVYWENGDVFLAPTDDMGHCQDCHYAEAEDDSVFRLMTDHASFSYDGIEDYLSEDEE